MDATRARELATKIADGLFRNGLGQRARRLVLELEHRRDGGGWCKAAAVDCIASVLTRHERKGVMPVAAKKKVKPNYKRPQYVGKLKATGEQSPIKKPAPRKEPWT